MDYQKKKALTLRIAQQLEARASTEDIEAELKNEGLYDRDITNIIISARNILGDKHQAKIKEYLLADKKIIGAIEFSSLDSDLLEDLIKKASQNIALDERKKMTHLIKEGYSPEEALEELDTRFLSTQKASEQIATVQQAKTQNSGGGRMLNIVGGLALIVLTIVILFASGRLFYFLPIVGIILIGKGLMTERIAYDD